MAYSAVIPSIFDIEVYKRNASPLNFHGSIDTIHSTPSTTLTTLAITPIIMLPPISSMQATAALWALLTLGSTISAAPTTARNSSCLPVVDLGYVSNRTDTNVLVLKQNADGSAQELHRALWHNKETDIYKFQNIRYAQEPKGDLRFRAPVHPKTDRSVIRLGSDLKICPQGRPDWQGKAYIPIAKYSNPKVPFTLDGWKKDLLNSTSPPGDINANATEDCLLLDVHVPKKVFDQAALGTSAAPVLVWVRCRHSLSSSLSSCG